MKTTTAARLIRSSVAGGIRLSITLLMGISLLVSPAVIVHAAPPSLKASQNPVVIGIGKNSGQFTLSWNSGNGAAIELWGSHNGGPDIGPFPAPAMNSSLETINNGETVLFKMYTPGKKQLLATLKVTTTSEISLSPTLPLDVTCAQQCIKDVTVDPHGTFAGFHIVTTGPAKVVLEAHEDGQPVASSTFNLEQLPDWHTHLLNLKPNTKYLYTVRATDGSNNAQAKSGHFQTLRRQVTVMYNDIHIVSENATDMNFWFSVNGPYDEYTTFPNSGIVSLNAGDDANPNYTGVVMDVSDTLTLRVFGFQSNCSGFVVVFPVFAITNCRHGIGPNGLPNGSDDTADWATATGQIAIGSGNPLDEVYTDAFTITSPAANYAFTAAGIFTVNYV